jgi:CheY-like chemotaxis protein
MKSRLKTCLLVEDDREDQEFFMSTLNEISETAACYVVENGEEALNALREDKIIPHYIFTDLNMPRMNGFEFIKRLKGIEAYQHIPVIVYSTDYSEEHIKSVKNLGATAFYRKTRLSILKEILRKYFL